MGYRYFTQKIAIEIGIRGMVKNLFNRDVEAVVCCDTHEKFEKLFLLLKKGPPMSRVDDIIITELPDDSCNYAGFEIEH